MIRIGIPKETADTRVSMVPQLVEKFMAQTGAELWIEKGAGEAALFPDAAYEEAGAKIADRQEVLSQSDVVLTFSPLPESDWKQLSANTIMVSRFAPYLDDTIAGKVAEAGLRGYSLDMIPRTTLAQSMDVLSSLASIAGYRAVLEAAMHLPRYFPMMITAAGSIRPAQILILGAGVAGLQAIATAKRLGAAVEASDTRLAAKEEVESLGGRFVMVEGAKDEKDAGGYAVKQDEDFLRRQREEVQKRAVKADVIITTAQVRGHIRPLCWFLPKPSNK
jgi:NAD(P) transhydrogenase subunit alpha